MRLLKDANYSDAFLMVEGEPTFTKIGNQRIAEKPKVIEKKVAHPKPAPLPAPAKEKIRRIKREFYVEVDVFRAKEHAEQLKRS